MQQINVLGQEIRNYRKAAKQSLETTAGVLGIDRSHLNKIELGIYKPSEKLLNQIIAHFSVEGIKANRLRDLLTHGPVEHVVVEGIQRKEEMKETKSEITVEQPSVQVTIDPAKVQVLYTDSTFVNSSDYGLVLDVAQTAPGNSQQFIVARIGMSFEHAKKLVEVMNDHLLKNER